MRLRVWVILGLALMLTACQEGTTGSDDFTITVQVDGRSQGHRYHQRISVGQFLEEIGVILGPDDEVNPLIQTQLRDGMRITVTRVVHDEQCENVPVPYETERQWTQRLAPNETVVGEVGENGIEQICYRITTKDGIQTSRVEISRLRIKEPRNEILFVGKEPSETLIPIDGVLAFVSSGQAWIIQSNTANLSPLTQPGQYLDGRVFDLSENGRRLLFTVRTGDETDPEFSNELWAILNTLTNLPEPVPLFLEDVRTAQWMPNQRTYTVSYSTANPTTDRTGWRAYNDLHLMQLNPETGEALSGSFDEIISPNMLGTYAYWGRRYLWSWDGEKLAWSNSDGVGLVDLETGDFDTLLSFQEYAPLVELLEGASVWIPTLSWSTDGYLITTVHGHPYAEEDPEDSVIFDLAVVDVDNNVMIDSFRPQVGIWASPTYSPALVGDDGEVTYSIAYFQAREPLNSPGTQYDLWVADRDGSNAKLVFPGEELPGLRPDPEDGIAWSPTGRQIALIHQGNLWVIEVSTGQAYQITIDGQTSRPRWSRSR